MNKEAYMQDLRDRLTGNIGPQELEDVLFYYGEYFEDAGPERESQVIEELGHPANLARQIIGDQMVKYLAAETDEEGKNKQKPRRPRRSGLSTIWIVILAICASPIAIPIAFGMVSLVVAMVVAVLAVVASLGFAGVISIIGGILSVIAGLGMALTSGPNLLFLTGNGLVAVGIGILFLIGVVALAEICLVGIARLFSRILTRKGGTRA